MPDAHDDELLPFGISATTGLPLPSISDEVITALLERPRDLTPESTALAIRGAAGGDSFGLEGSLDAGDLAQTGWGVIYGPGVSDEIKQALSPLIEHRRACGATPLVIYDGPTGFRQGDTASSWLARLRVRLDVVNPDEGGVPFYLMIVASPESIPYEFQYNLDLYWGVGRVWFDDVAAFRRYAESVVAFETDAAVPTKKQVALFAPQHDFDAATQLFTRHVATPLVTGTGSRPTPLGKKQGFALTPLLGEDATKAALRGLYAGEHGTRPALVFSGGHGMAFDPGDARQFAAQGALVCNDWGGHGRITDEHWFSADDLPADAHVHGMVHFLFACHGGGCSQCDNFDRLNKQPRTIAPHAFLSKLPQALLSHPAGGALAVIAHVERAWAYSFQGDRGGSQIQGFRDVLAGLMVGRRIGHAMDAFNVRWAALSTALAELHVDLQNGVDVPLRTLGRLWVARDDARNFIVIGDPAVHLRVEDLA